MKTVLFVNATIGFSENLFLVISVVSGENVKNITFEGTSQCGLLGTQ